MLKQDAWWSSWGNKCACACTTILASSPAPSQLFSLAGKKRERVWDLKSRDKCWQTGVALALPQSINFKPVWHLWSIKRSSARPQRITLPSLIVSVAFFSPVLNQSTRKSRSPTICHPSYPSIWAYITHVTLDPRLPLLSRVCVEKIGEPGDKATTILACSACCLHNQCPLSSLLWHSDFTSLWPSSSCLQELPFHTTLLQ